MIMVPGLACYLLRGDGDGFRFVKRKRVCLETCIISIGSRPLWRLRTLSSFSSSDDQEAGLEPRSVVSSRLEKIARRPLQPSCEAYANSPEKISVKLSG